MSEKQRDEVLVRLEEIVEAAGGVAKAAKHAGLAPAHLARLLASETGGALGFRAVMRLALATGFSLDWLATGEGSSAAPVIAATAARAERRESWRFRFRVPVEGHERSSKRDEAARSKRGRS